MGVGKGGTPGPASGRSLLHWQPYLALNMQTHAGYRCSSAHKWGTKENCWKSLWSVSVVEGHGQLGRFFASMLKKESLRNLGCSSYKIVGRGWSRSLTVFVTKGWGALWTSVYYSLLPGSQNVTDSGGNHRQWHSHPGHCMTGQKMYCLLPPIQNCKWGHSKTTWRVFSTYLPNYNLWGPFLNTAPFVRVKTLL